MKIHWEMRRLAPRPILDVATQENLLEQTNLIQAETTVELEKKRARQLYKQARQNAWFNPIIESLRGLCGEGELCMYCSSTEPSQVEHFRPLGLFPRLAFEYNNYLWVCDICNRTHKGEKFPPDNCLGAALLNPLDDDVWEYFFINEELGVLVPRIDPATGEPFSRATSTCEIVGIDRDNVQIKRRRRYRGLRLAAQAALDDFNAGVLEQAELEALIEEWRSEPYQADIADYFLNGPGTSKEPFKSLLQR